MRRQQLAFAVLGVLRHHGAVQVEVDGVERPELREILVEQRPHLLVGILGDVGGRRRRRPGQRHDLVAELGQALHGAGDRDVEAFDARDHLRPAQQRRPGVGAHELLPGRLLRREGIGLVLESTHSDSRHGTVLPFPTFAREWTISPTCAKSWLSWRCWRLRPAERPRGGRSRGPSSRWSTAICGNAGARPCRRRCGSSPTGGPLRSMRTRSGTGAQRPQRRAVQRSNEFSQSQAEQTLAVACMRNKGYVIRVSRSERRYHRLRHPEERLRTAPRQVMIMSRPDAGASETHERPWRSRVSAYAYFFVASSIAFTSTGQYSLPWPSSAARSISSRTTSAPSAGTPRSSAIWMA